MGFSISDIHCYQRFKAGNISIIHFFSVIKDTLFSSVTMIISIDTDGSQDDANDID